MRVCARANNVNNKYEACFLIKTNIINSKYDQFDIFFLFFIVFRVLTISFRPLIEKMYLRPYFCKLQTYRSFLLSPKVPLWKQVKSKR